MTIRELETDEADRLARELARLTAESFALEGVDEAQSRLALKARIEHGRGMGDGGALNYGDCFSYALAKALDAPLLFIGDDLSKTDIVSAL